MHDNKRALLLASFFTLIAAGVGFAVRAGVMGDWSREFGFTKLELGAITGGGFWGFGVVIILSSLFVDRVGYKPLLLAAFVLHCVSAAVTLSASWVFAQYGKDATFWCLNIGMITFAVSNGLCEAVINPLVATLYSNQKTHYLNILHAGWPAGMIIGGIFAFFFVGESDLSWHWQLPWEIPMLFFLVPVIIYGVMIIKESFPHSEAKAAGVSFAEMLKEFAAPVLLMLLVLHAMVGYVELGTDSWIPNIMNNVIEGKGILLLLYTASIMFVLRFFAGPIVERINPLGLLFVSAVLGCIGLYLLGSMETGVAIILAATVYGLGKTFFWPTMLGVVGERYPRGGALTLGAIGGVGMLSAGFLGGPGIGYTQDRYASQNLQEKAPAAYERFASEKENTFLFFSKIRGLDGAKVATLNDEGKNLDQVVKTREERGQDISEDENLQNLYQWWGDAKQFATEDKDPVKDAGVYGGRMALKITAAIPATMALGYLILLIYFRMQGGYKAVVIDGGKGDGG